MQLTGFLLGPDNEPLQHASVSLVTSSGKSIGAGTYTDDRGFFSIDHPSLSDKSTMVEFSYVGMKPVRLTADEVYDAFEIFLEKADSQMEEVVFVAKIKKKKKVKADYTWPIVLGSCSVVLGVYLAIKKFS